MAVFVSGVALSASFGSKTLFCAQNDSRRRRARSDNPKVAWFKSRLRNQRKKDTKRCPFCVGCNEASLRLTEKLLRTLLHANKASASWQRSCRFAFAKQTPQSSLTPNENYAIIATSKRKELTHVERSEQNIKNTFFTETDITYAKEQSYKAFLLLYLVLSAAASLSLLISTRTFLFFEIFVFMICLLSLFINQKNLHDYRLRFENDLLCITDRTTGESFWVYDTPASDFLITQTPKEKKLNYCSVAIKHTVFMFGGIKHCAELEKYISENFQPF